LSDWDTFSIDGLFDFLEPIAADRDAEVQVSFDPRWHFPTYVYNPRLARPRHVGGYRGARVAADLTLRCIVGGPLCLLLHRLAPRQHAARSLNAIR